METTQPHRTNGTQTSRRGDLSAPTWVAIALVVIGAINWGLVGLFKFDLVAAIFGPLSALSRIIYVLVAIAGVYLIAMAASKLRETPTRAAM